MDLGARVQVEVVDNNDEREPAYGLLQRGRRAQREEREKQREKERETDRE